jgi:hypothetical protein
MSKAAVERIREPVPCAHCGRIINFDPYVKGVEFTDPTGQRVVGMGDSYRGCWCERWWCCEEHALADGWVFRGDAYEVDHVSCQYCRSGGGKEKKR